MALSSNFSTISLHISVAYFLATLSKSVLKLNKLDTICILNIGPYFLLNFSHGTDTKSSPLSNKECISSRTSTPCCICLWVMKRSNSSLMAVMSFWSCRRHSAPCLVLIFLRETRRHWRYWETMFSRKTGQAQRLVLTPIISWSYSKHLKDS